MELPNLDKGLLQYQDQGKNLMVFLVIQSSNIPQAKQFAFEWNLQMPVLLDQDNSTYNSYIAPRENSWTTPHTVVIDDDGIVIFREFGEASIGSALAFINKLPLGYVEYMAALKLESGVARAQLINSSFINKFKNIEIKNTGKVNDEYRVWVEAITQPEGWSGHIQLLDDNAKYSPLSEEVSVVIKSGQMAKAKLVVNTNENKGTGDYKVCLQSKTRKSLVRSFRVEVHNPAQRILMYNDFDYISYKFVPYLAIAGVDFFYYQKQQFVKEPDLDLLSKFDVVIWHEGNTWAYSDFSDAEAEMLGNYIDQGGNLLLIGSNVLYDLTGGELKGRISTRNFGRKYLHVKEFLKIGVTEDGEPDVRTSLARINGFVNSPIYDNEIRTIDVEKSLMCYADLIEPDGEGIPIFSSPTHDYPSRIGLTYESGESRLAFVTFPLEVIQNKDKMMLIQKRLADWLLYGKTPIFEVADEKINISLSLEQNPVFDKLVIKLASPVSSKGSLSLLDLRGRVIISTNIKVNAGDNRIIWNDALMNLPSGIYYLQAKVNGVLAGDILIRSK